MKHEGDGEDDAGRERDENEEQGRVEGREDGDQERDEAEETDAREDRRSLRQAGASAEAVDAARHDAAAESSREVVRVRMDLDP